MSACKGCGAPIVWGLTPEGKRIPLDPKPPVYAYEADNGNCLQVKAATVYVTHFATCPKANDFSGKNGRTA